MDQVPFVRGRDSRPPGFDMTYRPTKVAFLPPLGRRLPSMLYFGVANLVALAVVAAPHFPDTWLYQFVVLQDQYRVMTSTAFAILIFTSAFAAFLRQTMTGVIVHPDGIELREILPLGVPRIRRWAWAQINRVAIPPQVAGNGAVDSRRVPAAATQNGRRFTKIRLDLWNGAHAFLPDVSKGSDLAVMIERVALARAIPVEGGTGLLDDLENPFAG